MPPSPLPALRMLRAPLPPRAPLHLAWPPALPFFLSFFPSPPSPSRLRSIPAGVPRRIAPAAGRGRRCPVPAPLFAAAARRGRPGGEGAAPDPPFFPIAAPIRGGLGGSPPGTVRGAGG